MVHHNTVSLDKLVEMAWMEILTKYAVDEECDFLVSLASYISELVYYVTLHLDLMMTPAPIITINIIFRGPNTFLTTNETL